MTAERAFSLNNSSQQYWKAQTLRHINVRVEEALKHQLEAWLRQKLSWQQWCVNDTLFTLPRILRHSFPLYLDTKRRDHHYGCNSASLSLSSVCERCHGKCFQFAHSHGGNVWGMRLSVWWIVLHYLLIYMLYVLHLIWKKKKQNKKPL